MTPAVAAARKAGVAFTLHEYDGVEHGTGDYALGVAAALGVEAQRLFKTLVVEVDGALAVEILPADRQIGRAHV